MLSDLQLTHAAFEMWLQTEGSDNLADLERAKRMLPLVLDECVTVTQRNYILKYYLEKMSTVEIAEFYGVDKSTVSRTIRRGLERAYGYLRFVSPLFIRKPEKRATLSNGKKPDNRGGKIKEEICLLQHTKAWMSTCNALDFNMKSEKSTCMMEKLNAALLRKM